jgi:hypothetical protein
METDPKKQRQQFYRDYASGEWSMSELCGRYQISRPTGYKWIDRIESGGLKAVGDLSRAPYRRPNRTPEHIERELLALREKYGWGATKLRFHRCRSAIRRPPHDDGQKPRRSHEKATRRPWPQSSQYTRRKPCASTPQRRKARSSCSTKRGVGCSRCAALARKAFELLAYDPVEKGLLRLMALVLGHEVPVRDRVGEARR